VQKNPNQTNTNQNTNNTNMFGDLNKNFNNPNSIEYMLKNNIKPQTKQNDNDEFQEVVEDNYGGKSNMKGFDSKLVNLDDLKGNILMFNISIGSSNSKKKASTFDF